MIERSQHWTVMRSTITIAMAALPAVCVAGQYGNDTAATARPIMADGTTYLDQMTPADGNAWFVFRMDPNQSYSVDIWNPDGPQASPATSGNQCFAGDVYEADGTTSVGGTVNRYSDFPAPQVDPSASAQGVRFAFVNSGAARRATVHIVENGPLPTAPTNCAIRVVTTTLVSSRWSVNGYSDFIALSNVSDTASAVNGSVLYFDDGGNLVGSDPFTLAKNASKQIVKANGVAIGGALHGGIRIVHDGAPGTIVAHQLWYNPATNAYVQYPFVPLVHSYSRGGL